MPLSVAMQVHRNSRQNNKIRAHSEDANADWFIAQLKPNCHKIAVRNLARQGFGTFLPMQERTRARGNRFIGTLHPLFPGYVFVGFNPSWGSWRAINGTYGVARLVSFGTDPTPVPFELINGLRIRCDPNGIFLPLHRISAGDRVRLSTGPFADFVATVDEIDSDKRVWVLIELLGRTTRLLVPKKAVSVV